MTRSQLQRLSSDSRNQIGGHTVTHPILSKLNLDKAREEIEIGKKDLEQIIGRPVDCFAYPNGIPEKDYQKEHVSLVRDAGFALAVSTSAGGVGVDSDPLQLPRFTPWDDQHIKFGIRMLHMAKQTGGLV
jgi:peptidoglycan/xylan/chitin deacetylase (PgdA/CDA1 family)